MSASGSVEYPRLPGGKAAPVKASERLRQLFSLDVDLREFENDNLLGLYG